MRVCNSFLIVVFPIHLLPTAKHSRNIIFLYGACICIDEDLYLYVEGEKRKQKQEWDKIN